MKQIYLITNMVFAFVIECNHMRRGVWGAKVMILLLLKLEVVSFTRGYIYRFMH